MLKSMKKVYLTPCLQNQSVRGQEKLVLAKYMVMLTWDNAFMYAALV